MKNLCPLYSGLIICIAYEFLALPRFFLCSSSLIERLNRHHKQSLLVNYCRFPSKVFCGITLDAPRLILRGGSTNESVQASEICTTSTYACLTHSLSTSPADNSSCTKQADEQQLLSTLPAAGSKNHSKRKSKAAPPFEATQQPSPPDTSSDGAIVTAFEVRASARRTVGAPRPHRGRIRSRSWKQTHGWATRPRRAAGGPV